MGNPVFFTEEELQGKRLWKPAEMLLLRENLRKGLSKKDAVAAVLEAMPEARPAVNVAVEDIDSEEDLPPSAP